VLGKLARQHDPNVLVGFDHADDAGVYQLSPNQALVQTVDFFTPIVDDPYTFGQIAATNSLSDVYAMGGRPLTALALVCFPDKADLEILERILAGGLSKMIEAGCTVIGGHSIRDEETKFGYSVTGLIHPARVYANQGAKPGDSLILTKALGTGVISTAIKKGKAQQSWIDAAVQSMTTLNKKAAEVITGTEGTTTTHVGTAALGCPVEQSSTANAPALDRGGIDRGASDRGSVDRREVDREAAHHESIDRRGIDGSLDHLDLEAANRGGIDRGRAALKGRDKAQTRAGALAPVLSDARFLIHALTDITGFGLIGHLREMLLASNVSARISASKIPLLEGALDCVHAGHIPGGLKNNRDFAECMVDYAAEVPDDLRTILYDPQTAGGLLISTPDGPALTQALNQAQVPAVQIGEIISKSKPQISVK
jgi:selenophosphate synthase